MARRVLVIQVAGLGQEFLEQWNGSERWCGLRFRPAASVFPAVTCPVQASLRTGSPPSSHGMMLNGAYSRELRRPFFWEQSSALVEGRRIWEALRASGRRVGMLFWQQSLGEAVDVLLSPAPIHKHGGGMVDAVYSRPAGLYAELTKRVGRRFKLSSYWGPLASAASSRWIAEATAQLVGMPDLAPDLLLTYLPHLDYALLRHGPGSAAAARALAELADILQPLLAAARDAGYAVLVLGDYAFADVDTPLYPNRLLLEQGLLKVRDVRGRLYPDYHYTRAFAVADHELAHVYVQDPAALAPAAEAFRLMHGVAEVLVGTALAQRGLAHRHAADIVLVAGQGAWFAYPWWERRAQRPDYATHVDIHNKPGFDPCELFFGWPPPFAVSSDPTRIKGSHGRVGQGREVAWAATWELGEQPSGLIELAGAVKNVMRET